jgi:catechol 2,3-dioxygenase-like lactoylglutathione lyase family enzyme
MAVPSSRLEVVRGVEGIDHVTIGTRDYHAAKRFYEAALEPLGFSVMLDWPAAGRTYLGLPSEASSLWLVEGAGPGRLLLSLAAPDRAAVDAFYAAARESGGRGSSPPGFRPEYTASTYAAEAVDPDGNVIEAVCRNVERATAFAEHAA